MLKQEFWAAVGKRPSVQLIGYVCMHMFACNIYSRARSAGASKKEEKILNSRPSLLDSLSYC